MLSESGVAKMVLLEALFGIASQRALRLLEVAAAVLTLSQSRAFEAWQSNHALKRTLARLSLALSEYADGLLAESNYRGRLLVDPPAVDSLQTDLQNFVVQLAALDPQELKVGQAVLSH
jgi:hypothetical protein